MSDKIIDEIKNLNLDEYLPDVIDGEVKKHTFQSDAFRRAGYHMMPDTYGLGDRFLYTIDNAESKIFIVTGKVNSDNPFEVGHGAVRGLDLREIKTLIYHCLMGSVYETDPDTGITNKIEDTNSDKLMEYLLPALGTSVD